MVRQASVTRAKRMRPQVLRGLSFLKLSILLSVLGLVLAMVLHAMQWVYSWVMTLSAKREGAAEVCEEALPEIPSHEFEIVGRAPWGYACETYPADGGFAVQEHPGATSVLFSLAIAIALVSVVVLVGVFLAVAMRRVVHMVLGERDGPAAAWATGLIVSACMLTPWTLIAQYAHWYTVSNSGDGSPVCPSSFRGDELLGFSIEPSFFPPHLSCHGATVTGQEFTTSSYGWPLFVFLGCLALLALAAGIIIVARVRAFRRRSQRQVIG